MSWLLRRLREPSTWRGIIWVLTSLGVTLNPEIWEHITAMGMGAAGLIGVLTSDKPELPPIDLIATPESVARQLPVQPDYSPKEPTHPVDQQSGWNN